MVNNNRSIADHDSLRRWGIILAGGDGKRLLPLTRKLTGEDRPNLLAAFESLWAAVEPGMEEAALDELWSSVPASDFSHEVLAICPSDLAVFPVEGLGWTDLGEPERVLSALKLQLGPIRSTSPSRRAAR